MAAVFVPVAALRSVGQTQDQLEGLDPQFNTGKGGGEGRGEDGEGRGEEEGRGGEGRRGGEMAVMRKCDGNIKGWKVYQTLGKLKKFQEG